MSNFPLIPPRAPNLPLAPGQYEPGYLEKLTNALRLYFNTIDNFSQNITTPASGTTASRPTIRLLVGQFYFDTTLGIPIWYDGTNWVDATGATV
jgi:hypothetical protein